MKRFIVWSVLLFSAPCFAELNIVLLGAPGSGKGTLGKRLAQKYGVPHISTGDIIREQIELGTPLGLQAKAIAAGGGLLADTAESIGPLVEILKETLKGLPNGFILEGFPRTSFQALALDQIMKGLNRRLNAAVSIEIADQTVVERLAARTMCPKCKRSYNSSSHAPRHDGVCDDDGETLVRRADDQPEVVRRRLDIFHQNIGAVLEFYEHQQQLVRVDAERTRDADLAPLYEELERPYPRSYLQSRIPRYADPSTGVMMYNLIEMYKDVGLMQNLIEGMRQTIDRFKPDYLAAPEARALPFLGALSVVTKTPGIFIRGPVKIPAGAPRISEEYFAATSVHPKVLEMTNDPALRGKTVVLIDDGLSSGGTTAAAVRLLERAGLNVVHVVSAVQYHYRGPCEEFLVAGLPAKTTTYLDLN